MSNCHIFETGHPIHFTFLLVCLGDNVYRKTLDCEQSNYSSRIVFSYISIEFGPTGNSAIQSADPEYPTL